MLPYDPFLIGRCFLLAREMDAVRHNEWRILPILRRLGDRAGYLAFTGLHVPRYALLLRGLVGAGGVNRGPVIALDTFSVAHLALRLILRALPGNTFRSPFPWALSAGAGLGGAADLLLPI